MRDDSDIKYKNYEHSFSLLLVMQVQCTPLIGIPDNIINWILLSLQEGTRSDDRLGALEQKGRQPAREKNFFDAVDELILVRKKDSKKVLFHTLKSYLIPC